MLREGDQVEYHHYWNLIDGLTFFRKRTWPQRLASIFSLIWLLSLSLSKDPVECVCRNDQFSEKGNLWLLETGFTHNYQGHSHLHKGQTTRDWDHLVTNVLFPSLGQSQNRTCPMPTCSWRIVGKGGQCKRAMQGWPKLPLTIPHKPEIQAHETFHCF